MINKEKHVQITEVEVTCFSTIMSLTIRQKYKRVTDFLKMISNKPQNKNKIED